MNSIVEKINRVSKEKNIPLTAQIELTKQCNLKCRHCYHPAGERHSSKAELSTREIKTLLDELAEAGSLYLLFTGGEVFLREDFIEVLKYARRKRFAVNIFTNGTLIDAKIAAKLFMLSPISVGISLYSMKPEIHDEITGIHDSYKKTIAAIMLLLDKGVKVEIKTLLMKKNYSSYKDIVRFARGIGANFGFDLTAVYRNDGNPAPAQLRIGAREIEEFFSDTRFALDKTDCRISEEEFICSAGKNMCAITSSGEVLPCLQFLKSMGNIRNKSFAALWQNCDRSQFYIQLDKLKDCRKCISLNYCKRCPGLALLEEGDLKAPWKRACEITDAVIKNITSVKNALTCSDVSIKSG